MSRKSPHVDAARLAIMLTELRLPTIKAMWPKFTEQADQEGWPAAHTLATLAEQELADRARRRIERHLTQAQLPPGKTLANFDFEAVPMISKAQVMALAAGDRWLDEGANLILFGPPGVGKSHLAAAIGLALVEAGIGCSTPAPPTSSNGSRLRGGSSPWKRRSQSSTSTIC